MEAKGRYLLFGLPHIGEVEYKGDKPHLKEGARCAICGRPATNAHHIVPKGMGGGSKYAEIGGIKVMSPLIAVCGMGNADGCHGKLHAHDIELQWVWDNYSYERMWSMGMMLRSLGPHSQRIGEHGCWIAVGYDWMQEVS